jgi:RNA polymerase II subunit A C-terminal domain phosphatase SSU72
MVRFATICASNMNRSMEAHHVLRYRKQMSECHCFANRFFTLKSKKGFEVCSFGTNSQVKMPGPTADRPNTYSFGQTYEFMYGDLKTKDSDL